MGATLDTSVTIAVADVKKRSEGKEEDQVSIKSLTQALSNLKRGNYRAALQQAADAVNDIAGVHDQYGGAWY